MSTITHGDVSRVRIAEMRDVDELMVLCREMHEENGVLAFSEYKVRDVLENATRPEIELRRSIIGCIGDYRHIEAAIVLGIEPLWYSDEIALQDYLNFVRVPFRNSTNSSDLIAWAKAMSVHFSLPLMAGVVSNQRTQAKIRHFRRAFGEPVGAFFLFNAGSGVH